MTNKEHLHTFKNFPVYMGTTNNPISKDIAEDMNIYIDKDTGVINVHPVLPLNIVYQSSHNSGTVGKIWYNHHKQFSNFVYKHSPTSIFEIGGGNGHLADIYPDKFVKWTILDPNPLKRNNSVQYLNGFFDESTLVEEDTDTIIHSHVFEHMYDPDLFVFLLSKVISNKKLIFSVPNMKRMLEKKFLNCINFEHTYFLDDNYIDFLFAKHGLKIVDKEYYLDDHSIFYSAIKDTYAIPIKQQNNYAEYKTLYLDYVSYYTDLVSQINNEINKIKTSVYLFGAHIFSQYLINFGLDITNINCLLDNDSYKHGQRLYGTSLITKPVTTIYGEQSLTIIIHAGALSDEIKNDILKNINPTAIFI